MLEDMVVRREDNVATSVTFYSNDQQIDPTTNAQIFS